MEKVRGGVAWVDGFGGGHVFFSMLLKDIHH